jgi:hypothetical protein
VYCLLEGPDEDAIRKHHAALGVPCGDLHQVDSLTCPIITTAMTGISFRYPVGRPWRARPIPGITPELAPLF